MKRRTSGEVLFPELHQANMTKDVDYVYMTLHREYRDNAFCSFIDRVPIDFSVDD